MNDNDFKALDNDNKRLAYIAECVSQHWPLSAAKASWLLDLWKETAEHLKKESEGSRVLFDEVERLKTTHKIRMAGANLMTHEAVARERRRCRNHAAHYMKGPDAQARIAGSIVEHIDSGKELLGG